MLFEWHEKKAAANKKKHGVSFEEGTTVFTDVLSLTIPDPLHSGEEERFVIICRSSQRRILVVVHTDFGKHIRIISARLATAHERKRYEESQI